MGICGKGSHVTFRTFESLESNEVLHVQRKLIIDWECNYQLINVIENAEELESGIWLRIEQRFTQFTPTWMKGPSPSIRKPSILLWLGTEIICCSNQNRQNVISLLLFAKINNLPKRDYEFDIDKKYQKTRQKRIFAYKFDTSTSNLYFFRLALNFQKTFLVITV